ncbi:MAG: chorismate mutase [Aphanocapsa feldmannii 277cV]|uniref:chorismate mutase n=2 Tax=Aphanocapsa feldmannii TaxID=192050 RepID=A0A524RQB1_9CHRO|nr:MAG: chorismate mutase [Aphanocapsa feldmannii 288cV]TGG94610.1 MAG: chorismate mutase [Aphanocapsa feldmannii 277cV]TGH23613.1 MAG: chorismate mutase [Aphanocapsa feldmannii 277cI]
MHSAVSQGKRLVAIRGATTVDSNTAAAMREAVSELLDALLSRNLMAVDDLLSLIFSVTTDLDAIFPASVARHRPGWDGIALLDTQQMAVRGDLKHCIRLLAQGWIAADRCPDNPYLRGAVVLRSDRS